MREHEFKLIPSSRLLSLLAAVFVISLVVLLSLPLHPFLKGSGLPLLGGYFSYLLARHGLLLNRTSIRKLNFAQGRIRFCTHQASYLGKLCGESTVTRVAMVLRFKVEGHFFKKTCLVMPDSLPAGKYRELLVLLRM